MSAIQGSHKRVHEPEIEVNSSDYVSKRRRLDPETVETLVGRKVAAIQTTCSSPDAYFPLDVAKLVMNFLFDEEKFRSLFMITQDRNARNATDEEVNGDSAANRQTIVRNALFANALADYIMPGCFSLQITPTPTDQTHNYRMLLANQEEDLRGLTDEKKNHHTLPCRIVAQRVAVLREFKLPPRVSQRLYGTGSLEDLIEREVRHDNSVYTRQVSFPPVEVSSVLMLMSNKTSGTCYPLIKRTKGKKVIFAYFNDNLSSSSSVALPKIADSDGYYPVLGPRYDLPLGRCWQIEPDEQVSSFSSSSSRPAAQASSDVQIRDFNLLSLELAETKPSAEWKLPYQLSVSRAEMIEYRMVTFKECSEIGSEVELYHLIEAIQNCVEEQLAVTKSHQGS